jgi:type II secretory pathway component GspD/PulD (secretin)
MRMCHSRTSRPTITGLQAGTAGRLAVRVGVLLLPAILCGPATTPSEAAAYCYITSVTHEAVSNAVQIEVKADGILKWDWEGHGDGGPRQVISVRFPGARLKIDEHFIEVDEPPVSTLTLFTPQDAGDGTGIVMQVDLTASSGFKGVGSTDERSFVLTIEAPLRSETADRATSTAEKTEGGEILTVDVVDGLVGIRALRADIHRAVAEVARRSGLNVAVDDAVSHKINVNLHGMPPLDVIRAIATGYGLALSTNGDMHMLSEGVPKDLTTYNRSGTQSFPMRYLRAEDAKELLPSFLTKYVHFNPEQNAVVATAPDQLLDKVRRDLGSVDLPPPMIMVDVLAVELTGTGDFTRDFSWLYSADDKAFGTDSADGEVVYETAAPGAITTRPIPESSQLKATLSALRASGRARIRSNPRIAAVNGKSASIFIGQDRFILVTYLSGGNQQERIEAVPVGVRLEVTPWTGGNGEITTNVDVEVSNISEIDPATRLPLLSSRRASSTVRTRDGETIVIGGLRQEQRQVEDHKIPLLGDIPLIGRLFRGTSTSTIEGELVIFVTPRILSVDGEVLDPSQAELEERFLEPGDLGYSGTDEHGDDEHGDD